jgi:hypothetical protein
MALPAITRKPTSLEWWIFKWIFLPVAGLTILSSFVMQSVDLRRCKQACAKAGYEFRYYTPQSRGNLENKCFCVEKPREAENAGDEWIQVPFK